MNELGMLWRLGLALVLSSAIGVERELRRKDAGLRTHALVGAGAAGFMLVSGYGLGDLVARPHVTLDPSRVAAQIVSGIGFIGGGIIFVRRDVVRGLNTAAGVWMTAAVGMACGGDLPLVAVATTVVYFIIAYAYPVLVARLPRSQWILAELQLVYLDGSGTLREALAECADRGFSISDMSINHDGKGPGNGRKRGEVTVDLELRGRGSLAELARGLAELTGVVDVRAGDANKLGLAPNGSLDGADIESVRQTTSSSEGPSRGTYETGLDAPRA